MTKKLRLSGLLLAFALISSSAVTQAQRPAGRGEVNDPEFAEFVKKATTKPEFLSPLVDHLPRRAGVPTPKDVLGYHIGTPRTIGLTLRKAFSVAPAVAYVAPAAPPLPPPPPATQTCPDGSVILATDV